MYVTCIAHVLYRMPRGTNRPRLSASTMSLDFRTPVGSSRGTMYYVCVHMYLCIACTMCVYIRMYLCIVCVHMYVITCTYVCVYMYVCMCLHVRMYVFTCVHVRRWVVCSGGCFLRFHWKGFGGRSSNYRFGKPHQLAIDGTMPANIKKFLGGDLFGAGWGIPGLPLMNSFMKPLQLPILYRICASREKH